MAKHPPTYVSVIHYTGADGFRREATVNISNNGIINQPPVSLSEQLREHRQNPTVTSIICPYFLMAVWGVHPVKPTDTVDALFWDVARKKQISRESPVDSIQHMT